VSPFGWYGTPKGDEVSEDTDPVEADELEIVVRWRRCEALAAGMSREDAREYAESTVSAEDLRHLIELHCPAELLAQVLGCNVPK
jgi:hypothetical protein